MKVLVLNCGSSSIKYKLYNMDDESVLAQGGVERIGLDNAFLNALINNNALLELITTLYDTVSYSVDFLQIFDSADFLVEQALEYEVQGECYR